jgi:hypothetical protein
MPIFLQRNISRNGIMNEKGLLFDVGDPVPA